MVVPHIPVLRLGSVYESLDATEIASFRGNQRVARVSQANGGLIRKDLKRIGASREALGRVPSRRLMEMCAKAGELFRNEALPLGQDGERQTPQQYIEQLSSTSGLPHALCRRNMAKIHHVLTQMPAIVRGLTRGLDPEVLDAGVGEQNGVRVSFYGATDCLGVVLPSNSPGVNSLWLPAIALKLPVILKPGREEPWTPYRIIQALIAAGCPAETFGFYPTDHEGSNAILQGCGRALIFGDKSTVERYAGNPNIQVHGPGFSKVLIGEDEIERWPEFLDLLVSSIADNGGRSCINASAIVVPKYAREIADALANRLAAIQPVPADDPNAQLAGFVNPQVAESIDSAIAEGLRTAGAEDVTTKYRGSARKVEFEGAVYLRPTIVLCDSFSHPLANREFLFPYASVCEVPQDKMLERIGPSLVVTAITRDEEFKRQLLASPQIDRLNIGPISTMKVSWDQPHEGNLFEFLYKRRAIDGVNGGAASVPRPSTRSGASHILGFDHLPHTRVVFGPNTVERIGELVHELPARKILLVTDAGIVAAGHADRVQKLIEAARVSVVVFDRVQENPTTCTVHECLAMAQAAGIEAIVGLGGGSSMDTAKGCNFLLTNGGRMQDYWGIGKATRPMLPLIAIPTTAGTGSECQSFALIADEGTHQKMACGDPKAAARIAILDPMLTVTQPKQVTAATGIDAVAHAVETAVTTKRNEISWLYSREAFRLTVTNLPPVLSQPNNLEARAAMQLGAAYAGIAIENSMLGAAHGAANPLTARFGIVHGRAVGLMLPHAMRFNANDPTARALYDELARAAGLDGFDSLFQRLLELVVVAEIPRSLSECNVPRSAIPALAEEAARQWTAQFNPRPVTAADFAAMYNDAW